MRGAGCIINDFWDYKFDQKVFRTSKRPLAANQISFKTASFLLFFVLSLSLLILIQLPTIAWIIATLSLPLIIFYPYAKRITNYPQFILGLVFSWGIPLGCSSIENFILTNNMIQPFFLYIGTVAWVFGYDSIYSIQDKLDDINIGVKSTALTFGNNLKFAIFSSYFIATIFWIISSPSLIWFCGVIFASLHMIWQLLLLEINSPSTALKLFKSNRDLGLILASSALLDLIFKNYFAYL